MQTRTTKTKSCIANKEETLELVIWTPTNIKLLYGNNITQSMTCCLALHQHHLKHIITTQRNGH